MVGLTVAKREDLVAAAQATGLRARRRTGRRRDPERPDAGRGRHERHHRRPHRRHRRFGLPVPQARHPAFRPGRVAADRRQLRHPAAGQGAARPRDPGPPPEGRPDAGRDRDRRSARGGRRGRQADRPGPRSRRRNPDQRLQPEPRRATCSRSGSSTSTRWPTPSSRRCCPATRSDQDHHRGQGAGPGRRLPGRRHDGRGRRRRPVRRPRSSTSWSRASSRRSWAGWSSRSCTRSERLAGDRAATAAGADRGGRRRRRRQPADGRPRQARGGAGRPVGAALVGRGAGRRRRRADRHRQRRGPRPGHRGRRMAARLRSWPS